MIMVRDINGYVTYGIPFSENRFSGLLAQDTEQTLTVPSSPFPDYKKLLAIFIFEPGSLVWVALNDDAEAPSGSVSATTSEGNPAAREVQGGDVLHFITNDTSAEFGVTFYAIQ